MPTAKSLADNLHDKFMFFFGNDPDREKKEETLYERCKILLESIERENPPKKCKK